MSDPGKQIRILLIEDNAGDVELLKLALADAHLGSDITVFSRGGEALAFFKSLKQGDEQPVPDLVILDLNLPQYGGVEILEAMRLTPGYAAVPVVVFSSSSLPRERERLQALGVRHYMTKPADLDELMKVGPFLQSVLAE